MSRLVSLWRVFSIILIFLLLASSGVLFLLRVGPSSHAAVSQFVTRSGAELRLNNQPFRFSGANIYWLGLDENVGGVNYPTQFRVDDALATASEMGANVVRAHSLGVSVGCRLCVEPMLGSFNETALQHIDYALKVASDHGIRVIIPLTDNYHYYHGGKHTFTDWRGVNDESQFYYSPTIINDFKQYIATLLNRVNSYTGVAYKNDSTILAWETGNELLAPVGWTRTIADYIKSVDGNHLVLDGNYGVSSEALALSSVDIYSDHVYPLNVERVNRSAATTLAANKAFYVGEYAWNSTNALDVFLAGIEGNGTAGDTYWSLFPHSDTSGYVAHGDGFALYYPGKNADVRARAQQLRAHAYAMRGLSVPAHALPTPPVLTGVSGNRLSWRGAASADTYTVERATNGQNGPWTVICDRCATDNDTPWTDSGQPGGKLWYRVRGYNLDGIAGTYSDVYQTSGSGLRTLTDNLDDWSKSYSHTANLAFDDSNAMLFGQDTSRASRTTLEGDAEIVWKQLGLTQFVATTYFWPHEEKRDFVFSTSLDGVIWSDVAPAITGGAGDWQQYSYTLSNLSRVNYVKMRWQNVNGQRWSPQISQATLTYAASVIDPLNDWSMTQARSANLAFDTLNANFFRGDGSRLYRGPWKSSEEVIWRQLGMSQFVATTYFWPHEKIAAFSLYVSTDGNNWTYAVPVISSDSGDWRQYSYTLDGLQHVNYVKMRWNNLDGQSWSPQISQVVINA